MTRIFSLLLLLCAVAPPTRAQLADAVRAFDSGTEMLEEGRYSAAVERFDAAETAGYASVALYHNRGIAHYRMDELGLAIRDFLRAQRLDGSNRAVEHSLEIARSRIRTPVSRLPRPWTEQVWSWIGQSPGLLFVVGMVAYLILLALLALRLRGFGSREWLRRGIWTSGPAATLLLVAAFAASVRPPASNTGVIVDPEIGVRAQADPSGEREATVSAGITVRIEEESGTWVRIQLPNGVIGWIPSDAVARV